MHRFMLLLGLGATLLAAGACAQRPDTPLTRAAARNDVAALRHLLDDGHEADEGGDSWTPLIWAARSGSVDAINVLLDSGADVNRPGPTGDNWDATPLQHAILQRQPATVRLLLDRGADVNRSAGGKPDAAVPGGRRHRSHHPHIAARPRSRPERRRRTRSHAVVSCGVRRHTQRARPSDVRRLPRRNGARAHRARSGASCEAQRCLERRNLVGARPEV